MNSPVSFDEYVHAYDEALQRGIRISGESRDYFAEHRVQWTADRLHKLGENPGVVLDFGCGNGATSQFLLKFFNVDTYLGFDSSSESIRLAEERFGTDSVRFRTSEHLASFSNCFDIAYCNGVFHHIPVAERRAAAELVHHVLRPGGFFALWENNPWNPGTRYIMSRIPFDRDAVTLSGLRASALVRSVGFKIIRCDFLFFFPRVLRVLRFLEPHLACIPMGAQYMVLGQKP